MKILITGIAGFVGSALAKKLSGEHQIFGVDNLHSGNRENVHSNVNWYEKDIRDTETFISLPKDIDIVVHLAAQTSGEKSFDDPIYDMQTNIQGTYNAYDYARQCQSRLFINMSSMSVYGNIISDSLISETIQHSPQSPYGNSKLSAERLLGILEDVFNVPVINLRLFNAYGPGQNLDELKQGMVSIYLFYLLRSSEIVIKGSLERVRDLVFLDDIIDALLRLIDSDPVLTGTYNLCTGRTTRVSGLLDKLKEISGIDKPIICKPATLGDINGFAGDPAGLRQAIGWTAKTKLEDGLSKMINFYKNK